MQTKTDNLQPASFFIWEEVQNWFNKKIKSIGVKNCAFPMFVSQEILEREKDHIEGFAAEVAWVTHAWVLADILSLQRLLQTANG